MGENSEELHKKYVEILAKNGILDKVATVTQSDSGAKGDGMLSVTHCVTITFEDEKKCPLHLFVKAHTDNPSHEAILAEFKAFEKEARFFMEYLPAAKEYCKEKGLSELLDFYPECYYGDERIIVLENLVVGKGYEMLPHGVLHDFNTTIVALKTLAKHHAVSYAMIQSVGGEDKFFERFPNLNYDGLANSGMLDMAVDAFGMSLNTCRAVLMKNKDGDEAETLAIFNSVGCATRDVLLDALTYSKDGENLLVLNHGDYKSNNMMFLNNKETKEIIHQMAIDLQTTRYNTPGLEIVSYLFSSVDPTVRQTRLEELLNTYRHTLNEVSRHLGYPMEVSYDDLLQQYKSKSKFGFMLALMTIGPGMAIMKHADIDISKVDMKEMPNVLQRCLLKWIEENPDKEREMSEKMKNLASEYMKYQ